MEGESPLLKDGALSLQTSLSHRELPPRAPAFAWRKIFFALHGAGVLGGSFLLDQEVQIGYKVRLSHSFCGCDAREERKPYVSGDLSPLISRSRDSFPPRGSLLYVART